MSQIKSAEEVLKFLRSITKRPDQVVDKDRRKQQPLRRALTKKKEITIVAVEQKPRRRKVDENAVLRRIIDSLQPTMEQYYNNERQPYEMKEKSSATRLKIYLKQNQRILKTFLREQARRKQQVNKMMNDYEQALQRQYFFTIKDSYRDEVEVLIAKNKVSKENYHSLDFMNVLLVLIDSELKVYKDKQGSRLFRNIRLFEIDNVEYNDQPFIFMVVTFVKDKSKPHEYLYLKFTSPQQQEKWDRILYINFRLKDLKRKQMLFLTDFQEEQIQVRKTQADNKPYDVNIKKLIRYFAETGIDHESDDFVPEDPSQPQSKSRNTPNQLSSRRKMSINVESERQLDSKDKDNIYRTKTLIKEDPNDGSQVSRPDIRRTETEEQHHAQISQRVVKPEPKPQPSKLQMIEKAIEPGVVFEKENFFRNSKKRLTIKGNEFSYVDQKKAEDNSAKQSDIKTVAIQSISKVIVHDDGKLELYHGPDDKKLVMKGELQMFKQWLKLKMME